MKEKKVIGKKEARKEFELVMVTKIWWERLTDEEQNVLIKMLYDMSMDDFNDYGVGLNKEEEYCFLDK